MTAFDDLPVWVALLSGGFALLGALLTLAGALGLLRLASFYDRIHAPTLGTSWGAGGIIVGSIVLFSYLESRLVVQELLVGIFITVTTPVTMMLLARAALYRDRVERPHDVPAIPPPPPKRDEETAG